MVNSKKIFRNLVLFFYWKYRNKRDRLKILNSGISPKNALGKFTMIRKGTEIGKIKLGDYSYISGPRSYIEEAEIGKFCSIARQVIIGPSVHNYDWVTTSPIIVSKCYEFIDLDKDQAQKPPPIIGNDVWIGINATILRGVTIGDGAVIAAGSVVTKNVEPYAIYGGIPAKLIRFRFDEEIINSLLEIKWWDWSILKIKQNINLFYNIENFVSVHKLKN